MARRLLSLAKELASESAPMSGGRPNIQFYGPGELIPQHRAVRGHAGDRAGAGIRLSRIGDLAAEGDRLVARIIPGSMSS